MGRKNKPNKLKKKGKMVGTLKHCIICQTAQFAYLTAQTWFTSFLPRLLFCLRIRFNTQTVCRAAPSEPAERNSKEEAKQSHE